MVRVKISEGLLEGEKVNNIYGKPFYSFKGIPYAEPPLGDLRFKAPVPKTPWSGVRQAKEHGPECYQIDYFTRAELDFLPKGSEDCLYLNVYSPDLKSNKPLPVMVYIHGGAFVSGSGNDDVYGAEFLINHDVILVTFNYRLEVLGFLCLDTEDMPGNAGMKDQVAALRWVKKNIANFGGDPENVTIFGESAGAASVSFHLVSPMTKGLFRRAIMQSGTIACPWACSSIEARERALLLARKLGFYSNNDKEIYEFLKNQPVENIALKRLNLSYSEQVKTGPAVVFNIVSEKNFGQERFFFGDAYDALRDGIHEGVEVMNGYVRDEGIVHFATGVKLEDLIMQANEMYEFFVPSFLSWSPKKDQMEVSRAMKDFYLGGQSASKDNVEDIVKYIGVDFFKYGVSAWQKICGKRNKNKSFYYKFSCISDRNIFVNIFKAKDIMPKKQYSCHSDDLTYLFPMKTLLPEVDMNSDTFKLIMNITTLWTNFAKYGEPTPDNSLGVKWDPYTIEKKEYLEIGNELTLKAGDDKEIEFWEEIFRRYLPHMLPQ